MNAAAISMSRLRHCSPSMSRRPGGACSAPPAAPSCTSSTVAPSRETSSPGRRSETMLQVTPTGCPSAGGVMLMRAREKSCTQRSGRHGPRHQSSRPRGVGKFSSYLLSFLPMTEAPSHLKSPVIQGYGHQQPFRLQALWAGHPEACRPGAKPVQRLCQHAERTKPPPCAERSWIRPAHPRLHGLGVQPAAEEGFPDRVLGGGSHTRGSQRLGLVEDSSASRHTCQHTLRNLWQVDDSAAMSLAFEEARQASASSGSSNMFMPCNLGPEARSSTSGLDYHFITL